MKKISDQKLTELTDAVFVVHGEMKSDNGEDSYAFSVNDEKGMIAVFDGCGGIGSRKYDTYSNKTGAYIASRIAAETVLDRFNAFSCSKAEFSSNDMRELANIMHDEITARLHGFEKGVKTSLMKGSLTKSFPTTASIVYFAPEKNGLKTAFMWAGDSRGFVLDSAGLRQITRDDIKGGEDAYSNINDDGILSNVVSAAGDFSFNLEMLECTAPAVFISATDGCFNYYKTPMEFEYMLIETLCKSSKISQWEENIEKSIYSVTADDYTMSIAALGFGSFKALKKAFADRKNYLYKEYIAKLIGATEEQILILWNKYKNDYYRGV